MNLSDEPDFSDVTGLSYAVKTMPGTTAILNRITARPDLPLKWLLPCNPNAVAGIILEGCKKFVRGYVDDVRGPTIYKIGAAVDPVSRWTWARTGYQFDRANKWEFMAMLHATETREGCGYLEAGTISEFIGKQGCRNEVLGGEGLSKEAEPPYFVYVVVRFLQSRRA